MLINTSAGESPVKEWRCTSSFLFLSPCSAAPVPPSPAHSATPARLVTRLLRHTLLQGNHK
ncbi:hypothetical protein E2C01_041309 [Portunus trituberculatus]|uniref:Uncharacterized protein n=1 Tax=Portunus trituberculatus TaxID=210409 RepID=A0A5B7FQL6_PORTR|nr:hypothetical protein [Portunus trituberculatus]